ncbi:unnamed protein product [Prorocentrum cordatum]|uniref:Uncharacterized protein n=1 Tax=Prorocentrum cordatum TaxID=2364126 RepID=A0ABN9X0M9_9DINO|nr:unnamed protein product [Polarella glacialis]
MKALLASGDGVLRFTSTTAIQEAEADAAGGSGLDVVECGADDDGIKPFSPTVVELERDQPRDCGDILGVSPIRVEDPKMFWRSLWEMIKSFEAEQIRTISFWRFVSRSRQVASVEPWKLYTSRQTPEVDPPRPKARRQRRAAGGGRAGRQGRGRGGRGRGGGRAAALADGDASSQSGSSSSSPSSSSSSSSDSDDPAEGKDGGAEASSDPDEDHGETTESAEGDSVPEDADSDGGCGEDGDAHPAGGDGGEGEHDGVAADIDGAIADVFFGPPLPPPPVPPLAAPLEPPPAALGGGVAGGPKHLGNVPAEIAVRHRSGIIRFYGTTSTMVAQCLVPSHQGEASGCFLTRTCREMKSNRAKGRCLGLMRAWLGVTEETGITRWDHVHTWKPDHAERRDARRDALASGEPSFRALAEKERGENDGDVDGEPIRDP